MNPAEQLVAKLDEKVLWERFQETHAAYERTPSVEGWFAKQEACRQWQQAFLRGAKE